MGGYLSQAREWVNAWWVPPTDPAVEAILADLHSTAQDDVCKSVLNMRLTEAIINGDAAAVHLCIANGADVNHGDYPLGTAALMRRQEIVDLLLTAGAVLDPE